MLDEKIISQAIVERFYKKLLDNLEVDIAICGAGPSGLICAIELAKERRKVAIFERKLSIGGGMWAGGMFFNEIVVEKDSRELLANLGVHLEKYKENYFVADAVECVCALGLEAKRRGVSIFNGIEVEDILIRKDRVSGLVINWSAARIAVLHVDPLSVKAKFVVDATGHDAYVARIAKEKAKIKFKKEKEMVFKESSLWAEKAEKLVEKYTQEICKGLFVCGMAANSVFGLPRMGPVFGGMLLSGKKCACLIASLFKK